MAEVKDTHIVEIPLDEEHQEKTDPSSSIPHPLVEISESPGHLLLLKLWQREEDLFSRRISTKETRLDNLKREVFQLCCFFFAFHGFFLTLLFISSIHSEEPTCRKWWIPSCLSLFTSIVIVLSVQSKIYRYTKVSNQLQREKSDNRALVRCIQELRMKGRSFDLSKEPQNIKRIKSSSVDGKFNPLKWCSQNLVTISLFCIMGLIFLTCRFILCG